MKNLRNSYLEFFKSKGHTVVPSDSLVPSSDPTLLFTSAGMVQFKAHFLQQIPLTFTRAASSQRCLRTTDIDSVGLTARHLTFFEMLGNFSFGDYFKEEAIAWAWEFFTKELSLEKERLWISIFRDDDDAMKIWKKIVPESRIVRMGEESNFWTMGPTGPCGPCSEIYWDRGNTPSTTGPDDSDRWMEIWNLVFTQFDRQEDGKLLPLPKKNIDTGMGLERLASVVEGVKANFETSYMKPLIEFGENTFNQPYGKDSKKDISLRIVADHVRAVTMLIYDGILPSNEGRGYVLRRLLRRATRQASLFGKKEAFLFKAVPIVTQILGETASDLSSRQETISNIIKQEEERFLETIESGSEKLKNFVSLAKNNKAQSVSGIDVFKLYDTYGFPPELTKEILAESNLQFDEKEFSKAKTEAQTLAREGWQGSGQEDVTFYNDYLKKYGASQFKGYDILELTSSIQALLVKGKEVSSIEAGQKGEIISRETPFYPEGGGQVGDKGFIKDKSGKILAVVVDTQKPVNGLIVHQLEVKATLSKDESVVFSVDPHHREPTKRHHTATHLLHAALRKVLGTTVSQAGSLVAPEKLRFDYTHNKPLTLEEILEIENIVNDAILNNWDVIPQVFPINQARKMGAMALFGEKYGNEVRCLLVSGKGYENVKEAFSLELCGGTHVSASGDIGSFKIISDSSLAAGVRRIEGIAGLKAIEYFRGIEKSLRNTADRLKTSPQEVEQRVVKLMDKQKQLEQEIKDLKLKMAQGGGQSLASSSAPLSVKGTALVINVTEGLDSKELRTLSDRLKVQVKSGIVFAASTMMDEGKEKVSFVVALTNDVQKNGWDAGKIAKAVAGQIQGSGGGRGDFAQGGGQSKTKLDEMVKKLPLILQDLS
ncbi:MAG: alanine--tRNA ligase [Elusimicrobiota bacterium]